MLQLSHLTLGYPPHTHLLTDTTLSLDKGQLVILVGRNGAGKSTLLRAIAGQVAPLSGSIAWQDLRLDSQPNTAARTVCLMPSGRSAAPHLTVTEAIALSRTPYLNRWGSLQATDRTAINTAIDTLQLAPLAHRTLATLSDGEYQRTMLASALARHTPVILLDEPTAFLDYPNKMQVMQHLAHLATTEQRLIIVSTHDLPAAFAYAHTALRFTPQHTLSTDALTLWHTGGWQALF